jgi:hypothetical protein
MLRPRHHLFAQKNGVELNRVGLDRAPVSALACPFVSAGSGAVLYVSKWLRIKTA